MSRFTKLFAANAIAAAGLCSAALALSPAAAADPALPPIIPGVPGIGMLQQFATNPASMGAVLQSAATALSGASTLVGGAPAGSTLPVSPIVGAPGVAATAPVAPAAAPLGPLPTLLPLLNQFGVPGDIGNLAPSQMPFPIQIGDTLGINPAPGSITAPLPPAVSAPAVPGAAGAAGLGQLLPLSALP